MNGIKPIPGPDDERHQVIRRIIGDRLSVGDPILDHLDELPIPMLKLTAEAAILFIVEQFLTLFVENAKEQQVVRVLNEMHSKALAAGGQNLPIFGGARTLAEYVRHYLDARFSGTGPYTDEFIGEAIDTVKHYYGRL
jgi:hypothetical protein